MILLAILVSMGWLKKWGGAGLILIGVIDSSFIPVPGGMDIFTAILAASNKNLWFYYALMSSAGSVAGGVLTYRIGRKGWKQALEQRFTKEKLESVYGFFEKWGFGAVLVSAILPPPFPMVPFLAGAGALNYPLKKFVVALTLARIVRFSALAFLASIYGRRILSLLKEAKGGFLIVLLVAAFLTCAVVLIYILHRRRASRV